MKGEIQGQTAKLRSASKAAVKTVCGAKCRWRCLMLRCTVPRPSILRAMTVQSSLQRVQSDAVETAGACCQLNACRLQHYSMSVVMREPVAVLRRP